MHFCCNTVSTEEGAGREQLYISGVPFGFKLLEHRGAQRLLLCDLCLPQIYVAPEFVEKRLRVHDDMSLMFTRDSGIVRLFVPPLNPERQRAVPGPAPRHWSARWTPH